MFGAIIVLAAVLVPITYPVHLEDAVAAQVDQEKDIKHEYEYYTPEVIKRLVETEFGTSSVMVRISGCESQWRQFNKDGSIFKGVYNPLDTGVFQVNSKYHLSTALKKGLDIGTVEGNIKYARYLYDTQGTKPWNWSKECWAK